MITVNKRDKKEKKKPSKVTRNLDNDNPNTTKMILIK